MHKCVTNPAHWKRSNLASGIEHRAPAGGKPCWAGNLEVIWFGFEALQTFASFRGQKPELMEGWQDRRSWMRSRASECLGQPLWKTLMANNVHLGKGLCPPDSRDFTPICPATSPLVSQPRLSLLLRLHPDTEWSIYIKFNPTVIFLPFSIFFNMTSFHKRSRKLVKCNEKSRFSGSPAELGLAQRTVTTTRITLGT